MERLPVEIAIRAQVETFQGADHRRPHMTAELLLRPSGRRGRLRLRLGPAVADRSGPRSTARTSSRAAWSICPAARATRQRNHPGAEEIIFVISGNGEQMVEDEAGTPMTQPVGPGTTRVHPRKPVSFDAQHRQRPDAAVRRLFARRPGACPARPAGFPPDPAGRLRAPYRSTCNQATGYLRSPGVFVVTPPERCSG